MTERTIDNSKYLDSLLDGSPDAPEYVLLPYEKDAVAAARLKHEEEFQRIIEEKISVTGGDDWHDGAFRATDNEAKIVSSRVAALAPLLGATVVSYPHENETRVTLGSRVFVRQRGLSFPVDIVGYRGGYPDGVIEPSTNEEMVAVSPDSPLGKALMGHRTGEEIIYQNGSSKFSATIEGLSQNALENQVKKLGNLAVTLYT